MTNEAIGIRQHLNEARLLHQQLAPYEQAVRALGENAAAGTLHRVCDRLRRQEMGVRTSISGMLESAVLSPRQYTVIHLHYLQYQSWTKIADTLGIERRYALQLHTQAIERLASQQIRPCSSP